MFLFILESISTSELIFIAVVALIIFGPRKLPQMAKTIGKTMADFRNATNEFKSTWEKEIAFEEREIAVSPNPNTANQSSETTIPNQNSIQSPVENEFSKPVVRELSASDIAEKFPDKNSIEQSKPEKQKAAEKTTSDKRDWL
ncbi:MAG: Sec-independent protein translocase subunit TatA/TatB [Pyrinomonadaceae bacterium]